MDNEMMTVNEVADYLRMNPMTIYRMAQQGRIPANKILGSWRFKRVEIEEWIKSQEYQPSKILVIDDDPAIGIRIKEILTKKHKIITVGTAAEAIKVLESERFNLLFLDLVLPDTDGLTLYRQIKSMGRNIPVVVITGVSNPNLLAEVVAEGAQFILNKPFTDGEVHQMLSFIRV